MATQKKSKYKQQSKSKSAASSSRSGQRASASKRSASKSPSVKKTASRREQNEPNDIIHLILEDHKPIKELIKIMKDNDRDLNERQDAFEEFAPQFLIHAKAEEQSLYMHLQEGEDLREEGFEGPVEHSIAEELLHEVRRTEEEDLWSARVKVLAELVEHHIEEEEGDMLPNFRKHSEVDDRIQLGEEFQALKSRLGSQGERDVTREHEARL